MNEIGLMLKNARENAGVSMTEASKDLEINELSLKNIEEGNIGCFKDLYELKDMIRSYTKYLGLDEYDVMDTFNEYIFEYTSKIPIEEIEKKLQEELKNPKTDEIVSPYTSPTPKTKKLHFVLICVLIIILVILSVVWAVNQITM